MDTDASATRPFHIGAILSITDGKLVAPGHVQDIYDLLNWMTGESLMTHQLPRVSRECAPQLRTDFPDLAEISVPQGLSSEAAVLAYLESLRPTYGERRAVRKLDPDQHTEIDPVAEIKMMRPGLPIIDVNGNDL